ncbi:unnamed protein product [Calicophoron daubneyi]|uniref:Sodium/potassium-transporting ATPase subunit beta n=1 Tax=Calicophoron daubneyi TaxID=300641 RepID=A0AAV2TTN2_CALDB
MISRTQSNPSTKPGRWGIAVPKWLYNPKGKLFCGRTAQSWFLICVYYLCFYFILTCFSLGLLLAYMYTQVTYDRPIRTGAHSALNLRPGLRFRPMKASASIIYSKQKKLEYSPYVEMLDGFLKQYNESKVTLDCDDKESALKDVVNISRVCKFPVDKLGTSCSSGANYGYGEGKPCFMLTINKIYGWLPDIKKESKSNNLLVRCTGITTEYRKRMGNVSYSPAVNIDGKSYGQFENKYFPFIGQAGYLSPVVAVQLNIPKHSKEFWVKCELTNVINVHPRPLVFKVQVFQA